MRSSETSSDDVFFEMALLSKISSHLESKKFNLKFKNCEYENEYIIKQHHKKFILYGKFFLIVLILIDLFAIGF